MREKLWFVLVATVLLSSQVLLATACHKTATFVSDGDGDGIIEVGENIVWVLTIYIYNDVGAVMTDLVITDNLNAELEIDSPFYKTQGTVSSYTTGKSEKVHLTWYIGTLMPDEEAILWFYISTDLNPAGKQEYTSPGEYVLNSGPTVKYYIGNDKISYQVPSIPLTVLPQD